MKRSSVTHRTNAPPRSPRGFTLLELLVVMGIIAFLVGILVNVVGGVLATAREKNTKAIITKVNGLISDRMEAFTTDMNDFDNSPEPKYIERNQPFDPALGSLFPKELTPQGPSGNDLTPYRLAGGNIVRAKVLGKKALFRRRFPQSLDEIDTAVLSAIPGYISANNKPETESSEAMYIFLTKMDSYGQAATVGADFNKSELADTDNDGLMEIVDGWGHPLRFYRWPTRLIRPGNPATDPQTLISPPPSAGNDPYSIGIVGNPPAAYVDNMGNPTPGHDAGIFFAALPDANIQSQDADDQLGATHGATWKYNDGSSNQTMDPTVFERDFHLHTPETWSLPLVVSAGKDGILGLYEVTNTANYGHLAQPNAAEIDGILDNLSNRRMQP